MEPRYDQLVEKIKKLEAENDQLKREVAGKHPKKPCNNIFFEALVNTISGYIAYIDASSLRYEYVNRAFEKGFGISREEAIGKHIEEVIGSSNYLFALEYIDRVRSGESVSYENQFNLPNGLRWIKVNYAPAYDKNGNVSSIVVLSYDITEKKESEIKLKINEERYRLLIEESSDAIFSLSPKGKYIYVNKVFARSLRKTQEELIGASLWDIFTPEEANKRFTAIKKAFETNSPQNLEVHLPYASGDMYFITSINPVKDEYGNIRAALCIAKDISKRKEAEMKLQESEKTLRLANATKDKFFSIIAHDLKNPFNSILGLSELLQSNLIENNPEETEEIAEAINTASKNAFKLLQNLLQWSRAQTGNIQFKPAPHSLKSLIESSLTLHESMAQAKDISLHSHLKDDITLKVDKNMLDTVLRNLISNSIKFTHQGGSVDIKAEIQNSHVAVRISDNGIGIKKETLENLFSINKKSSNYGTFGEAGTGLGLILCKEFIEMHGGQICAESKVDEGSQFHFTLPLHSK